ncbi:MAG: cytochrome D1 domain-containing protein [Arenicellales bacterium]
MIAIWPKLVTIAVSMLTYVSLTYVSAFSAEAAAEIRGSGDLGLVVERTDGSVKILETSTNRFLGTVEGLGDLSHASVVYSRDQRYAYVFGRDGGLTRVDMLKGEISHRILQAGNSIGGAISQDGRLVAVSNYTPGGVRVFDSETLELIADIPATYKDGLTSKVVGLVDAPGNRFVFSLWDAGEIWIADMSAPDSPVVTRFQNVGVNPYDALITSDGRYYIAGLFGEDGLALLDLWHLEQGVRRIIPGYGKGKQKLPVYKMPHLEGWAIAGNHAFVPAVGAHQVLVIDMNSWSEAGRIEVKGQPIFVMAQPDGRRVWVNFALPDNDTIQVIDTESLEVIASRQPGTGVLHMEFEPRGEEVWMSVRDLDQVQIYNTQNIEQIATLPASKPSGIFFSARAHRTGL